MKKWKCTVCENGHTGDAPPEECTVCGTSRDRFVEVGEDGATPATAPAEENAATSEQTIKKWKCTVCGYIYTGAEPPDKCPVCGAPRNRFIELAEDGTPTPAPAAPAGEKTTASEQPAKKWKCTVCGYIHTGAEPPDKCPVCGAPKSQFVEVVAEDAPEPAPAAAASGESASARQPDDDDRQARLDAARTPSWFRDPKYRALFDMLTKYHGHPISVHIPNGLLPVVVLFIFLAALFSLKGMASAAVYNLGVVALAMPVVLFTGWVDWQNRFNGAVTNVFKVKIACGIVVTVTAWFLFIWLLVNPEVITTAQPSRFAFFAINLIMLSAASTAGWYGGKLVFRE